MNTLAFATEADIAVCAQILDEGRAFQKAQGFTQWTDDYPNADTIRADVRTGKGYVVLADGTIAGYLCIDFDGEPAYQQIEGAWRSDKPYAVVHRMAFSSQFRGIGLADKTFRLIETLCVQKGVPYVRIDTDFPNERMQHILEKNGFVRCGTIVFQGSGKIAYDKLLTA